MKWFRRTLLVGLIAGLLILLTIYLINRHINLSATDKIETSITEIPREKASG